MGVYDNVQLCVTVTTSGAVESSFDAVADPQCSNQVGGGCSSTEWSTGCKETMMTLPNSQKVRGQLLQHI